MLQSGIIIYLFFKLINVYVMLMKKLVWCCQPSHLEKGLGALGYLICSAVI